MPYPLSIIIRVACQVKSSIEALRMYRDLRAQFQAVSGSVSSAKTQFDSIAAVLDDIEDTLLSRPQLAVQWTSGEELSGESLQFTMIACEEAFAFIAETLYQLTDESLETCEPGATKVLLTQLWNASGMKTALKHVSTLILALKIFHSALTSEGKFEMMDILTSERSRTTFAKVAFNAARIRASHDECSEQTASNPSTPSRGSAEKENFDLDSYFAHSNWHRNAWRNSSNLVLNQGTRRHEHKYLAIAMASLQKTSQHPDQLSSSRFEVLEVSTVQGPWWQAKKASGEAGRVLPNYFSLFDARLPMHNDHCPRVVKAVYAYTADPRNTDELSFEKDEIMEAYDMRPGWWYAKRSTGEKGIVPAPYFILYGDAVPNERAPRRRLSPPPPYSPTPTARQTASFMAVDVADLDPPDMFSFLDDPPIAQAVWNALDQDLEVAEE